MLIGFLLGLAVIPGAILLVILAEWIAELTRIKVDTVLSVFVWAVAIPSAGAIAMQLERWWRP